ncbi:hypothetical protein [Marinicauda algicola]|uniref:hypothetical protein n=1 Tax=Marinicauda algicola TaxID=2029849 RepID=UPI0019CFE70F|nr:hypothetical protein [Marinicauda algicola]
MFGKSGSGKTCAALELGTHLPEVYVHPLDRNAVSDSKYFESEIEKIRFEAQGRPVVAVIDQYEEVAASQKELPSAFVERLALLDRGDLRDSKILFLWLTTSKSFQSSLVEATSRNERILISKEFEILSLDRDEWPEIIEETFQFHNDKPISDFGLIRSDIEDVARRNQTIGSTIEGVGARLADQIEALQDLSEYTVVMLWPVTDATRITRIHQFTDPRQGYKLDWSAWYRHLNAEDRAKLPLKEYNRARLYFDMRLVPIAAADLHALCNNLDDAAYTPPRTYLDRFARTHFYSIVTGAWDPTGYSPLRERESERARKARDWYLSVTDKPTQIGARIAASFSALGINAQSEETIKSKHSTVRADVFIERSGAEKPNKVIVELKAFAPDNTRPSSICGAVRTTLRRHAQFAGFVGAQ